MDMQCNAKYSILAMITMFMFLLYEFQEYAIGFDGMDIICEIGYVYFMLHNTSKVVYRHWIILYCYIDILCLNRYNHVRVKWLNKASLYSGFE